MHKYSGVFWSTVFLLVVIWGGAYLSNEVLPMHKVWVRNAFAFTMFFSFIGSAVWVVGEWVGLVFNK